MWCDDFDADLLAVVPGAAEALGSAGDLRLTTFSHLTSGRINHPACWHTRYGVAAFFWTSPEHRPDPAYITDKPEAECTFLEAVRDEWVHDCAIVINNWVIWQPPAGLMMRLMYDHRGWQRLDEAARDKIRANVLTSLRAAAGRLPVAVP